MEREERERVVSDTTPRETRAHKGDDDDHNDKKRERERKRRCFDPMKTHLHSKG